jgi:hypothetical protein
MVNKVAMVTVTPRQLPFPLSVPFHQCAVLVFTLKATRIRRPTGRNLEAFEKLRSCWSSGTQKGCFILLYLAAKQGSS